MDLNFQKIVEEIPTAIQIVNKKFEVIYVNESLLRLAGLKKEEIIGKKCYEVLRTSFCKREDCPIKKILQEKGFFESESTIEKENGERIPVLITAKPFLNQKGEVIGIIEHFRDISFLRGKEKQLRRTSEELRRTLKEAVHVLALTIEKRDPYTAGHQSRVAKLSSLIATEIGLSKEIIERIHTAGELHDIGKIYVPAEILYKPSKLSKEEFSLIKKHPRVGYEILKEIDFFIPVASVILQHHERLDGSGYPMGLKGKEILLEARILAVADVVEAMSSLRPYRAPLGIDRALQEISDKKDKLYDSRVVNTCIKLFKEKGFKF